MCRARTLMRRLGPGETELSISVAANDVSVEPIRAKATLGCPPTWALMQRRLFDEMDAAWREFERRYCDADGSLQFTQPLFSRDGADDFYESFFNWPVLYFLGGADDLLSASKHHWTGVTRQLTAMGMVVDEFERGYDWFHLGESMIFFYALCAADPGDTEFRDRAVRFADLYLPDSLAGNYDAKLNMVRAPHTGAGGPRSDINEEWQTYGAEKHGGGQYGLPLYDLPGISQWSDLEQPENARRMGQAMQSRMGRGDVSVNMGITGLMANAWLMTGDRRYSEWISTYVQGWIDRTSANDGWLPDNVGPSGVVGELHSGRWYGGHYGWQWPHGLHTVGTAALVGGVHGWLVSGDDHYLDLPRHLFDRLVDLGGGGHTGKALAEPPDTGQARSSGASPLLVPYRRGPQGWFDYHPAPATMPLWPWYLTMSAADQRRMTDFQAVSGYDWRAVKQFRDKGEGGHSEPWFAFLQGQNPDYPEHALAMAHAQVTARMAAIDADRSAVSERGLHHWQHLNPVVTEVLLQLTTGAPQVIYNGGHYFGRVRYFDADRGRPGLPTDVAALVDRMDGDVTGVQLVNVSTRHTRRVVVQAGGFAEHEFSAVTVDGGPTSSVSTRRLTVELPPATRIRLELGTHLNAHRPTMPALADTSLATDS